MHAQRTATLNDSRREARRGRDEKWQRANGHNGETRKVIKNKCLLVNIALSSHFVFKIKGFGTPKGFNISLSIFGKCVGRIDFSKHRKLMVSSKNDKSDVLEWTLEIFNFVPDFPRTILCLHFNILQSCLSKTKSNIFPATFPGTD